MRDDPHAMRSRPLVSQIRLSGIACLALGNDPLQRHTVRHSVDRAGVSLNASSLSRSCRVLRRKDHPIGHHDCRDGDDANRDVPKASGRNFGWTGRGVTHVPSTVDTLQRQIEL